MDIHRCRFVPYQPSAINAVAFSHPSPRSAKQASFARLAVGRANGDIEIWNPLNGTWYQELVIRGGKNRSVDGLVWVNEPDQDLGEGRVLVGKSRLFSIGYTSTVTEWDLEKGKPKRHASGQHGDIWCIAAQPLGVPEDGQTGGAISEVQTSNKLVAGTIDGELVMYSIEDDDLRLQRVLVKSPTKKTQMVSITFQSRKTVIVGCSDSSIRAYDILKGQMTRNMTLGSDLIGGSKDIIVWSVKCLPGGNIVSGDSTGQICIWDGKTYTQNQRIQSHKQDVLSITTSADGSMIMSGGMDRRTILYKPTTAGGQRWSKVWGRRYHNHDVKSMATFERGRTSVVVTAGPDSELVVVPLKESGKENHRTLGNLPQQPSILSAANARFIVSWWEREVHIWVLRKPATELFDDAADKDFDLNQNRKLLKTIVVKGDSNISSATINVEGSFLVVSSANDVKAFRLEHQDPAKPSDVKISSIELPERLCRLGASQVRLSPCGDWLLLVQEGSRVLMAKIDATQNHDSDTTYSFPIQRLKRIRRKVPRYVLNGGLGAYDRNITQVAFSADSRMVATADLAGYVDTWIRPSAGEKLPDAADSNGEDQSSSDSDSSEDEGDEATGAGGQWILNPAGRLLPKLPTSPVVLSFSEHTPSADGSSENDYTLLAVTLSWQILLFHPRQGSLTTWSRRHPKERLPEPVQDLLDLAKGVLWQGNRVWVYGVSFLLMLDTSQDMIKADGSADGAPDQQIQQGTKRKRKGPTAGAGGKMAQGNLQPQQVRKHVSGEQWEDIDMEDAPPRDDEDNEGELYDGSGELSALRDRDAGENMELAETGTKPKSWWITYKYRPIYGIVPLSQGDSAGETLEVALVERPTWDMDMPERYFAGEPWES